jgi:hypothetical protein
LAAAAVISVEVASVAVKLIADHGGYIVFPLKTTFASVESMPGNLWLTIEGVLGLFGADFSVQQPGIEVGFDLLHLVSVALAVWAVWLAARGLFGCEDLVVQVLTVAIFVNLAAYMFGVQALNIRSSREIAAVLPFGAVLAARLLATRLIQGRLFAAGLIQVRLLPVLAAVLVCYAVTLGYGVSHPSVPAQSQDLAAWLADHHLSEGLSDGYWSANSTTVDSGDRIKVRAISIQNDMAVAPQGWEIKSSWYDPRASKASFFVIVGSPGSHTASAAHSAALATFGRPERVYQFGLYTVLTWNKNLLTELR